MVVFVSGFLRAALTHILVVALVFQPMLTTARASEQVVDVIGLAVNMNQALGLVFHDGFNIVGVSQRLRPGHLSHSVVP
jgi:hypothetical protein